MRENIMNININYEVGIDIEELANDMAIYLEDALSEQYEGETCEIILDNETSVAILLDAVGMFWHKQFVHKVLNNKTTLEKEA